MDPEDFLQNMLYSNHSARDTSPVGIADTSFSRGGRAASIQEMLGVAAVGGWLTNGALKKMFMWLCVCPGRDLSYFKQRCKLL